MPLLVLEPPQFTPVQPEVFGAGGNLVNAWADYDSDGDLDLFVGFNGVANRLYRNDAGTLVDAAATVGVADARATRAGAWGDFDGDGDPDLLVGFAPGPQSVLKLYRNEAAEIRGRDGGCWRRARLRRGAPVVMDRHRCRWRRRSVRRVSGSAERDVPQRPGKFVDIAADVGLADRRKSVGAVWFDYDEDGDLDLYVANMDGDANGLYRNDAGKFTDVATDRGVAWGGRVPNDSTHGTVRPCAADVNGDGHIDIIAANYGRNGLFFNRGRGKFEDVSAAWGADIDSRFDACALADFDNDGRLDMYVNGTVTGGVSYRDYLLRNTGTRFEDVTPENIKALQADHGVQWADFDRDGDVDLALTGSRPDGMHSLLRNDLNSGTARRSLSVSVEDAQGHALLAGAEVRLYTAGPHRLIGTRLVDTGSGYDAQNVMPVHFGLPSEAAVDIEVIFPHGGKRPVTRVPGVDPRRWRGKSLVVRVQP